MLWFYESFLPVVWIAFLVYWRVKALGTKTTQRREQAASAILRLLAFLVVIALLSTTRIALPWLYRQLWPQGFWPFWIAAAVTVIGLLFAVCARQYLGSNWSSSVTIKQGQQTGAEQGSRSEGSKRCFALEITEMNRRRVGMKSGKIQNLSIVMILGASIFAQAHAKLEGVMPDTILTEAQSETKEPAARPIISIEDVDRFYRVYDAARGQPDAENLQHDYLDQGSEGLLEFAKLRHISGTTIAQNLAKHPEMYSNARRCADVLPRARERLTVSLRKLGDLYPEAKFPPVTVAVGHGKPVGVGSPVSGVQIGLEALCAVRWMNPNLEDRFVYVIAHEYAHVQQVRALVDDEHPTVLEASLVEGAAEFTAELIAGDIAYPFKRSPIEKSKAKEIEAVFVCDEDKTDLSHWLNNGTIDKPGDLGYWVGYRIVKSYYQRATNKREALREILQMSDPKAFVAKSGWSPGIQLR